MNRKYMRMEWMIASALLAGSAIGCGANKSSSAESKGIAKAKTEVASKSAHESSKGHATVADHADDAHANAHANVQAKAVDEAPIDEKQLQVEYAEAAKTEITADNADKFAEELEKQLDAELALAE